MSGTLAIHPSGPRGVALVTCVAALCISIKDRAKKFLASLVRKVLSWLMGCAQTAIGVRRENSEEVGENVTKMELRYADSTEQDPASAGPKSKA